MEKSYWNNTGPNQADYDRYATLMPMSGRTGFREIEAIRAASRIYHDFYNNGFGNNWSGAYNFLTFLQIEKIQDSLRILNPYRLGRCYNGSFERDSIHESVEKLVDEVVLWVKKRETDNGGLSVSDVDMFEWQERERGYGDVED